MNNSYVFHVLTVNFIIACKINRSLKSCYQNCKLLKAKVKNFSLSFIYFFFKLRYS